MSLERCLQELGEGVVPPKHALLAQLSGLTQGELPVFERCWSSLPAERRRLCIQRLVSLAEEDAEMDFGLVFRACLTDGDAQVRGLALAGLWECEDRSLIGPLMRLVKEDQAAEVRASAALSLGKFGARAQEGKLLARDGERIKGLLLDVLANPKEDVDVRRRALEAAACFNTSRVQELVRWAYQSPDPKLRLSAIYAMGRTGDPTWFPLLIKELRNTDPAVRYECAAACAELGEEEAVPHLIPLLGDGDVEVQQAAIRALGVLGGRMANRALLRCAKSEDEAVREAALEALRQFEIGEAPMTFKFPR